ncbi:MAG: DUF5719 family protein [Candidatus Geothermincolia bacterium]
MFLSLTLLPVSAAISHAAGQPSAGGPSPQLFRPGEVVVGFEPGTPAEARSRIESERGLEALVDGGGERLDVSLLRVSPAESVEAAARELEALPEVAYAEPNYLRHLAYTPSDEIFPEQWGMTKIRAPQAWDLERGSSNPVTVAVIDTGVDLGHPELAPALWINADEVPGNGVDDDGNGYIDDYHGYNFAGVSQWTDSNQVRLSDQAEYAQSITGTGGLLTHVEIKIISQAASENARVSIRAGIAGPDLSYFDITPADAKGVIERPLSTPLFLTEGQTYYIVCQTRSRDYFLGGYYNLYCAGDRYKEGMLWRGAEAQPALDLYFRTNATANPHDDYGHGTHVAGIVAAQHDGTGVAGLSPGVRLMPLKVFDCSAGADTATIAEAIRYAADNGAKVINLSVSGTEDSDVEGEAVAYAHARGAVIVAAAGNEPGDHAYPAEYPDAIAVSSTTASDTKASSSNYGSFIDLGAPGQTIWSTTPRYPVWFTSYLSLAEGYDHLSGTSMAAPHVAGLAALLASRQPALGPDSIEALMKESAVDLGNSSYFGAGRIDALGPLAAVNPLPALSGIAPTQGPPETEVTLTGASFGAARGGSSVSFGGSQVDAGDYLSWADDNIRCEVPSAARGALPVTVSTAGGTSAAITFSVLPAISALSPLSGGVGTEVVLTGVAFGATPGDASVRFGDVAAAIRSWSDGRIACVVPQGVSGNVLVSVRTSLGSSAGLSFEVLAATAGQGETGSTTYYFAEGTTRAGFQEYLTIGNPTDSPANVNVTYLFNGAAPEAQPLSVPALSRATIDVNQVVGGDRDVAVKMESDAAVVAERPMYFSYGNGWAGGHDVIGATLPSATWYFAEGCTLPGFEEYICVLNPGDSPAELTFNFQTEEEGEKVIPGGSVPARSRASFPVNVILGPGYQASLKLEASAAVVAERPMYFDYRGSWAGGHCVLGSPAPATSFYFAEGTTRTGFEEWLTLQNPNAEAIDIDAEFVFGAGQGEPVSRSYHVEAARRLTVFVADEVGTGLDVSVKLSSAAGFLAERPLYFSYVGLGVPAEGGHCVIGTSAPMAEWLFAEGCTLPGFEEWLCIQNPGAAEATVRIDFLPSEGAPIPSHELTVNAASRATVLVNQVAGEGRQLSLRVTALSGGVVVERPLYFLYGGAWGGGSNVVGHVGTPN